MMPTNRLFCAEIVTLHLTIGQLLRIRHKGLKQTAKMKKNNSNNLADSCDNNFDGAGVTLPQRPALTE